MTYNSNIPQPTDRISDSQPDILSNFQAIDTWTQVDHIAFNSATQGWHIPIHMVEQSSDPAAVANAGVIYAKVVSTKPELFYRYSTGGGSTVVQLTSGGLIPGAGDLKAFVRFSGTTGNIISQVNVSSVTRTSTGNYRINFTTPMANTNYAPLCTTGAGVLATTQYLDDGSMTVNSVNVVCVSAFPNNYYDAVSIVVAIYL